MSTLAAASASESFSACCCGCCLSPAGFAAAVVVVVVVALLLTGTGLTPTDGDGCATAVGMAIALGGADDCTGLGIGDEIAPYEAEGGGGPDDEDGGGPDMCGMAPYARPPGARRSITDAAVGMDCSLRCVDDTHTHAHAHTRTSHHITTPHAYRRSHALEHGMRSFLRGLFDFLVLHALQ
jgi:hypothetical protein